ncbi:hypothetical protein ACFE04_031780 [Oxalis oulophora]
MTSSPNLDDYSADKTTIKFDQPLPLLRGPTPSGPQDNPNCGPYVLAFKNPNSYSNAYKLCQSQILTQCEHGARIGCAITASNNCKPPWWRFLGGRIPHLKERERCEELQMEGCVIAAKGKCLEFANDKCRKGFRDARVQIGERESQFLEVRRLLGFASVPERMGVRSLVVMGLVGRGSTSRFRRTNCMASELLGCEVSDYH